MAVRASSGFSYADLADFPDDHLRRELIGGELIVTPAPRTRHQDVVLFLATELTLYVRGHGGRTYAAPLDVVFSDDNVVEPDVLYLGADHLDRIGEKYVHGPPDLVVEVSSPSTRHLDVVAKRAVVRAVRGAGVLVRRPRGRADRGPTTR
jgi:Uma2 family endonuclease